MWTLFILSSPTSTYYFLVYIYYYYIFGFIIYLFSHKSKVIKDNLPLSQFSIRAQDLQELFTYGLRSAMLDVNFILSTLAFLAIAVPIITLTFNKISRPKSLYILSAVLIALFGAKSVFDFNKFPENFYGAFGVSRDANAFDIRKAYKKVSLKYHPDKNSAFDSKEKFERLKNMYDVLIDEEKRDLYNRFGEDFLSFDPRQDEIKLISSIATTYVFWAVISYMTVLPKQCKACNIWVLILLLIMLVIETFLCLSESTLPVKFSVYTTEHEFLLSMHCFFPFALCMLRVLAEYFYVDLDMTTEIALNEVVKHEKLVQISLQHLHAMTTAAHQAADLKGIEGKLMELVAEIQSTNSSMDAHLATLKSINSNPIANYYWLLFVALYVVAAYAF